MATNSKKTGTAAKIGVMTLAIMNVAAVVSLRGLAGRSRIWPEFGFLLSVRCNRIFNPDFVGSGRTSGHVLQQRRWGISLGR